jgi:ketosteroid isomerase-like protein
MSVEEPKQLANLFAERASAADLDGLLALYERDATLVGPDGEKARGQQAIRELLASLLATAPRSPRSTARRSSPPEISC